MTRELSVSNQAEYDAAALMPVAFVELQFDEGTDYFHTGVGPLTWGGHTWTGVGDLGEVSTVEESEELSPFSVQLKLSGLASGVVSLALTSNVYGRAALIYLGALSDGALVDTPDLIWSGVMDTVDIQTGREDNTVVLSCESDLKFMRKANGFLMTDEFQQGRYSGDLAFQYVDQMAEARLLWGAQGGRSQVFTGPAPGNDTRVVHPRY